MNTGEINSCLKNVQDYVGTFPCNLIPAPSSRTKTSIHVINTARLESSDSKHTAKHVIQGDHWVVLIVEPNSYGKYFDSFGLPPEQPDINEYISEHCKNGCSYNTQILQDPFSRMCGPYCLDFIYYMSDDPAHNMSNYLFDFKTNLKANDRLVAKRVKHHIYNKTRNKKMVSKIESLIHS